MAKYSYRKVTIIPLHKNGAKSDVVTTEDEMGLAQVTSIKIQRIQCLWHVMRRVDDETIEVVIEWKPEGKKSRG